MTLAAFETALQAAVSTLQAIGANGIDVQHRSNALSAMARAVDEARIGVAKAVSVQRAIEEQDVVEAWREGRVTIRPRGERAGR